MAKENISGLSIFGGAPVMSDDLWATTGRVFYLGSTAAPGGVVGVDDIGGYGHSPHKPFATLNYAFDQCTASRGDTIVVLPGHAETRTAAVALDVAGVRVIGLGSGRNRPAFTRSGAIDLFAVSAANIRLHNLRLLATADTGGALLDINAADLKVTNCVFEHGTGPLVAVTVPAAGDRFWFEDCLWLGTAAGPDICIDLEASGAGNDFVIRRCIANYRGSSGLDLAFIRNNVDTTIGGIIDDLLVLGADTLVIDFNSSLAAVDGLINNLRYVMSATITSIEDALDLGGYLVVSALGTDVVTAHGGRVPITTAS